MFAVSRVPTTIVDVVDVVAVRDRDMPAAFAVGVAVALMDHVSRRGLAFVVVTVMLSMKVTVMYIVDVIAVRDRDMPAAVPMDVIMARMLSVCFGAHGLHHPSDSLHPNASSGKATDEDSEEAPLPNARKVAAPDLANR
jgi:hypothetical protein